MRNVIVIHEIAGTERLVIGVASSRETAIEIIKEYYGEHEMSDFEDVRESNIDFTCLVTVEGKFGGDFDIIGECFIIDSI